MPTKIPSIIAGLSTFLILIALGILSVFMQMLALNGANESTSFNAMIVSVICQSVYLLIAVILARWLVKLLITKFKWNTILAIVVAVIVPIALGVAVSFLAIIVTIPIAIPL